MLGGPPANGLPELRLAGVPTGDQQPRVFTWQAPKALHQVLQALVGQEAAEKPVGEGVGRHAEGSAGLLARHRVGIDPDEVGMRDNKEIPGALEYRPHVARGHVAVRDDRRCQAADRQAALVVNRLMATIVWVDVVGGPDQLVA